MWKKSFPPKFVSYYLGYVMEINKMIEVLLIINKITAKRFIYFFILFGGR